MKLINRSSVLSEGGMCTFFDLLNRRTWGMMLASVLVLSVSWGCERQQINRNACTVPATQVTVEDTCRISFPNIFTPNGDGINDVFGPITSCQLPGYSIGIFASGGRPVYFASNNPDETWDGVYEGEFVVGEVVFEVNFVIGNTPVNTTGKVMVLPYKVSLDEAFKIQNCSDCRFPDQANANSEFVLGTQEPVVRICD